MDRHDGHEGGRPEMDDETLRALIGGAGKRAPLPEQDLARLAATARAEWDRSLARPLDGAPPASAWARNLIALAAALVAAAGLGWWWFTGRAPALGEVERSIGRVELEVLGAGRRMVEPHTKLPAGAILQTASSAPDGQGGRAALVLADGTSVRLDEDTRVRLVSASVLELERGAVYIDTERRTARERLEIRTAVGVARDVGTRFTARVDLAPPSLRVQVRQGAVAVERARGKTYQALAGHELVLLPGEGYELHDLSRGDPAWEWVMEAGADFDIEGRSVQEFLDWVGRETAWTIRFEDAALAAEARRIVLHGNTGRLRADRAPFVVLPGAGLEGSLDGDTLAVRRAARSR